MRTFVILMLTLTAFSQIAGCQMVRNLRDKLTKDQEDFQDDYKVAGEEGRAELPREKETDGLTPFLESPKARAINKNLGID